MIYKINPKLDDTVWYFGCSITRGGSVEPDQTAPYYLSQLTGISIDNLGISGGSPDFIYYQIQTLIKKHKPKAIIIQWPDNRRTFKMIDGELFKLGVWVTKSSHPIYKSHPNLVLEYKKNILNNTIKNHNEWCKSNVVDLVDCPIIQFTYEELLGKPLLDYGKDNKHPGPITHRTIAEILSKNQLFATA